MADQHDWLTPIVDAVVDHAARLGRFETVNRHEGVSPPGHGLTAEVWARRIRPTGRMSGLAATSVVLLLTLRVKMPAVAEPRDEIDPVMTAAVSHLLAEFNGDLTLGGRVMSVDVFGAWGLGPLEAQAGWLPADNQRRHRVVDVSLPLLIEDLWVQGVA